MFDTIWDRIGNFVIFIGPFFWGGLLAIYLRGGISTAGVVGLSLFGGIALTVLTLSIILMLEDFVFWCKHHNDPE